MLYSFSMKTCTSLNLFSTVGDHRKQSWRTRARLRTRQKIYLHSRVLSHKQDSFVRCFFLVPPVSRIPAGRENAYRKYGWKLRNNARNVVPWGERARWRGRGRGRKEEKKICGTKEKASHRVGRLWKMRCQEYCCVGSRRPSQVFTGTLWNSFERMKLLSNAPLQPTDDMQPTGLESN